MSSRAPKGKERAVDRSGPSWSAWTLDQSTGRYYRAYQDASGNYVYEYDTPSTQSAAEPRSSSSSSAVGTYVSSAATSDSAYQDNSEYTFHESQQGSSSVENLSGRFAATSLNGDQTPRPTYSVPYGQGALSTYSDSRGYSAQPTSTYSGESTSPVIASSQTPGYTTSYGAGSNTGSSTPYVAQPTAYSGAEPSSSNSSYEQGRDYGISRNPYPRSGTGAQQPQQSPTVGTGLGSGSGTQQPGLISGTSGSRETLDPDYKIHLSKYFKRFHVFKVLWPEPQGTSGTELTDEHAHQGSHGQTIHYSFRRFVIVVSGDGHCQCVPILTYGHQGTTKRGINPNHHAIIYTSKEAPRELRGEAPLRKRPIQVVPNTPRDKLLPDSRVNYAKIYTVEHNVKVLFTGRIAQKHEARFITDFDETWTQRTSAHDR